MNGKIFHYLENSHYPIIEQSTNKQLLSHSFKYFSNLKHFPIFFSDVPFSEWFNLREWQ